MANATHLIVLLRLGWLTVLSSMNIVEQELYFFCQEPWGHMIQVVAFSLLAHICLRLVEEECAGSGVVRWVGLLSQFIWELPVADVLQVGPGVFTHVLSGGDGTLLQLHFSPVDLGTLSRRDAARH